MDKILKAAQLAPTAVNYQPQKIYILKSGQAVETIRSICSAAYDAPVVFLICADESLTWKHPKEHGYSTGEMDASIVCTHMMLEAWELGIGSVWVRAFDSRQVARAMIKNVRSEKSFCGADLPEPLNTTENLTKNKKLG